MSEEVSVRVIRNRILSPMPKQSSGLARILLRLPVLESQSCSLEITRVAHVVTTVLTTFIDTLLSPYSLSTRFISDANLASGYRISSLARALIGSPVSHLFDSTLCPF
jgi:hypothetical protein